MEYGDSIEKKLKAYKLMKAKYEIEEKPLINDEVFSKSTVPEIIAALKEELISRLAVAETEQPYSMKEEFATPSENTKKKISRAIKQLDKDLQDYLSQPGEKLCDFMVKKMNELKLNKKASKIYEPVMMKRDTFSKLIRNHTKEPTFETCVQMIFGFKLNIDEANEFLRIAGRSFNDSDYHRTVKFFVEQKDYEFDKLNKTLWNLGLKTIGCK